MNNIEELNIEYLKINARSVANGVAAISSKWAGETMLALIAQLEASRAIVALYDEKLAKAEAALSAANEKLSKPVVLPDYRCSPDMHTKQYYETIGFNLGLDACKAVIKTAGFTVEGNADAE